MRLASEGILTSGKAAMIVWASVRTVCTNARMSLGLHPRLGWPLGMVDVGEIEWTTGGC